MAKPVRCAIAERVRVAAVAMLAERGIAISRAGDAGTERLSRACVAAGIDRAAVWLAAGVCPWVGGYVWLPAGSLAGGPGGWHRSRRSHVPARDLLWPRSYTWIK